MTENTQTVADTAKVDAEALASSESPAANSAPDLEAILKEYEGASAPKPNAGLQAEEAAQTPQLDESAVINAARKLEQFEKRQQAEDFNRAVKAVKGDLPFTDDIVSGFLNVMAGKDKRLVEAYVSRDSNPQKWNSVVKALNNELRKQIEAIPNRQVTADLQAAAASARSLQNKPPEAPVDVRNMSDAEFERYKEQRGLSGR